MPVVTPPVSPGVEEAEVSLSEVQQVVMQLRGALSLASVWGEAQLTASAQDDQ